MINIFNMQIYKIHSAQNERKKQNIIVASYFKLTHGVKHLITGNQPKINSIKGVFTEIITVLQGNKKQPSLLFLKGKRVNLTKYIEKLKSEEKYISLFLILIGLFILFILVFGILLFLFKIIINILFSSTIIIVETIINNIIKIIDTFGLKNILLFILLNSIIFVVAYPKSRNYIIDSWKEKEREKLYNTFKNLEIKESVKKAKIALNDKIESNKKFVRKIFISCGTILATTLSVFFTINKDNEDDQ